MLSSPSGQLASSERPIREDGDAEEEGGGRRRQSTKHAPDADEPSPDGTNGIVCVVAQLAGGVLRACVLAGTSPFNRKVVASATARGALSRQEMLSHVCGEGVRRTKRAPLNRDHGVMALHGHNNAKDQ